MILLKVIIITSPATDAGKTFVASGLAEAGTDRGLNTLFIDFDNPVGDANRVFGTNTSQVYPTVTSWSAFNDPWDQCLRSSRGTYVLPKPNIPDEGITSDNINRLLKAAEKFFDLVICDLGTDFKTEYWAILVRKANLSLLVSDCDEKALVRIREFLSKLESLYENSWILMVNNREDKGYYSTRQMIRYLGESDAIRGIVEIPHFKNIQKGYPKTFSPNAPFAQKILDQAFGKQVDLSRTKIKKPKMELRKERFSLNKKPVKNILKDKNIPKANLIILYNITSVSGYKGYVVDASGELSRQIETSEPIWKADWRLGIDARPLKIHGVNIFTQTEFLGSLDELDQVRFIEFIENLLTKKKPVYVIDSGRWREELLRLGAVIMEGGS